VSNYGDGMSTASYGSGGINYQRASPAPCRYNVV